MRGSKILDKRDKKTLRFSLDLIEKVFRLARFPFMRYHPWFDPGKTDMRWLPINAEIEMPENAPLPLSLLGRLIEEASHRVIYTYCGCREAYSCRNYPVEIGCLLMGDSAVEGRSKSCREVSVQEAKEHARRAVDAGLVPVVGKARIDNALFSIPDRGRLLTVCFCCECCCITRFTSHAPMRVLDDLFPRLDGLKIQAGDDCAACGKCAERCYIQAITIKEGKARISERCRGCGRCVEVCPRKNICIIIEDADFLENAYERIRAHVKFD